MTRMFWQRCPRCGRLVLARLGGSPDCGCTGVSPAALRGPEMPLQLAPGTGGQEAELAAPAVPPPVVRTPPRRGLLTPAQDATARRLLEEALPPDWTF